MGVEEISVAKENEVIVVVPTIRADCMEAFLEAWEDEFAGRVRVLVIEDNPERSFDLGERDWVEHFAWAEIDADLGADSWIIPRRSDCVRSYGYLQALRRQPELVITLDDDCYPHSESFVERHRGRLREPVWEDAWTNTLDGATPRGVPYQELRRSRDCMLSHGLWTEVADFDALTQLARGRGDAPEFSLAERVVPSGRYFPMCGMNLAFRPELIPALYFLLMGREHAYDRFGDIWAGLFAKKICDHLGWAVRSGEPFVEHRRASNVWSNLAKEVPGLPLNEQLWQVVDGVQLTGSDAGSCYRQLAEALAASGWGGDYGQQLSDAMSLWVDHCEAAILLPQVPPAARSIPPTSSRDEVPATSLVR